jgi:cyanate permease
MIALFQIAATLALGALSAFLVKNWEQFIGDKDMAFLIGFPILCLIAWLYDRRQAQLRKSNRVTIEHD